MPRRTDGSALLADPGMPGRCIGSDEQPPPRRKRKGKGKAAFDARATRKLLDERRRAADAEIQPER